MINVAKKDAIRLASCIQGWCRTSILYWLYNRAKEIESGGIIVEVGVWKGRSLCALALGAKPSVQIVAVDTFGGNPQSLTHFEATHLTFGNWSWVRKHVELLDELIFRIRGEGIVIQDLASAAAALFFLDDVLDIVHLDPDYRKDAYDQAKLDIERWLPKVRPNGILCGSTYINSEITGVMQAVNELLPGRLIYERDLWYWRKPK